MAKNKFKHGIFKEMSSEDGGTIKEVESIVESALEFTKKTIEKGEFSQVRLPYFGKFHVNPKRLQNLNNEILHRRKPPSKS